ncbi:hypothetical protein HN695_06975 [Candidatus Woesearchaeota archaeon]|nr:hypothetical protein [Candidatus Woesearchaeota archaeon]MBT5271897.1 hypothetical protein [Candidatus Woesearchaeota archaeon]MBT6040696.1 hypothetical protein [Candidatus Woesearchaeota archaeon]MBT6336185.1 hypothetical protein [Candidatus Woesearchaeota archaeon]MBT7928048.1 hypothetical protein [Candidatus Woesearchaeota archaeon]
MGLFSFKKKKVKPNFLEAPPAVNIRSESNNSVSHLSEPDIPPIGPAKVSASATTPMLNDDQGNNMDEAPMPPTQLKESSDFPPMPLTEEKIAKNEIKETQMPEDLASKNELPMFPSMPEENTQMAQLKTRETQDFNKPLPFEHSYNNMPSEQELKETFKPRQETQIKKQDRHYLNYDQFLTQSTTERIIKPKTHFVSITELGFSIESLNLTKEIINNQVDTVLRINNIQEEKGKRYDKFQKSLELIYKELARLDGLMFET